ncbi:hypothetical protein [Macrococcus capreoli]|uniref:hypothetical protein n=1 Tax=Macrococcus capreoli TaxID=2982690 RepID=UPI003EE429D6
MRILKRSAIALTTASLTLSLAALDINSSEASITKEKPASTVEIVSTEMNSTTVEDNTMERPSTENKTTETPTIEKKTDEPQVETPPRHDNTSIEIPTKETIQPPAPVTTEQPMINPSPNPTPQITSPQVHVTTEQPHSPQQSGNHTPPVAPTPTYPTIPVLPIQPPYDDSSAGGSMPPVHVQEVPVHEAHDHEPSTAKPDKFSPCDGEDYYLALDKHVGELVTAKIGASSSSEHTPTRQLNQSTEVKQIQQFNQSEEKLSHNKSEKKSETKEKETDVKTLPGTGETTGILGVILILLLTGAVFIRKK